MAFEHKTETEARQQILDMVAEYCDTYHNKKGPFQEGDRIPYASRVYDHKEMVNLVDSSLEFWLTSGRYTDEFEKKLADYLGVAFLLLGELRFLRQFGGLHDADIPFAGGAQGKKGR